MRMNGPSTSASGQAMLRVSAARPSSTPAASARGHDGARSTATSTTTEASSSAVNSVSDSITMLAKSNAGYSATIVAAARPARASNADFPSRYASHAVSTASTLWTTRTACRLPSPPASHVPAINTGKSGGRSDVGPLLKA